MTRELKLALILGCSLVLVVGVLVSDHLSGASEAQIAVVEPEIHARPVETIPGLIDRAPAGETSIAQNPSPQVPLDPPSHGQQASADGVVSNLEQFQRWAAERGFESTAPVAVTDQIRPAGADPLHELTMGAGPSSEAASGGGTQGAPGVTEYVIQKGDTLWSLAARFYGNGQRHTDLVALNQGTIVGGVLRPGIRIKVPAAVGSGGGPAPTTIAVAEPKRVAAEPAANVTKTSVYTVKAGDTLFKIAEKTLGSKSRWNELYDLNRSVIKDKNVLNVGTVLRLPKR